MASSNTKTVGLRRFAKSTLGRYGRQVISLSGGRTRTGPNPIGRGGRGLRRF